MNKEYVLGENELLEINYAYPKDGEESDYLLKIININLEYYKEKSYNEFEGVDKLFKLLTIKDKKELKEITSKEKLLNNYYDKMNRLSHDKEYCRMVWDERIDNNLRKVDAYNDGKTEGILEGSLTKTREMVINMYKDNLALELISKYTNLSISEVKEIIDSCNS